MTHLQRIRNEFETSTYWKWFGMEVDTLEKEHVVLTLPYRETFDNVRDSVHGGVYMSLLDTAMGMHCRTLGYDEVMTIDLSTNFLRPVVRGTLRATARTIHRTRSTVLVEGTLYNNEKELVAFSTATFRVYSHEKND